MLERVQQRLQALRTKLQPQSQLQPQQAQQAQQAQQGQQAQVHWASDTPTSPSHRGAPYASGSSRHVLHLIPDSPPGTDERVRRQPHSDRSMQQSGGSPLPFDLGPDLGPSRPLPPTASWGSRGGRAASPVQCYATSAEREVANRAAMRASGRASQGHDAAPWMGDGAQAHGYNSYGYAGGGVPGDGFEAYGYGQQQQQPPRMLRRSNSKSAMGSMSNLFGASMENLRSYVPKALGGGSPAYREASRRRGEAARAQWGGARSEAEDQQRARGSSGFSGGYGGGGHSPWGSSPADVAMHNNAPFNDGYTRARGGVALNC